MKTPFPALRRHAALPAVRHVALFAAVILLDQVTKHWARARFSLPNGEPDYGNSIAVLGDWLHLRLVYNYGAAFGTKPQNILPFLNPVVFFGIMTAAAVVFFGMYYRRLGSGEPAARLGILLIMAGAIGNLIDRLVLHRVTDFLDAGIPGFSPRWPVFNVADSSVCIGIALLVIPPFLPRKSAASPEAETPAPASPEPSETSGTKPHDA